MGELFVAAILWRVVAIVGRAELRLKNGFGMGQLRIANCADNADNGAFGQWHVGGWRTMARGWALVVGRSGTGVTMKPRARTEFRGLVPANRGCIAPMGYRSGRTAGRGWSVRRCVG